MRTKPALESETLTSCKPFKADGLISDPRWINRNQLALPLGSETTEAECSLHPPLKRISTACF